MSNDNINIDSEDNQNSYHTILSKAALSALRELETETLEDLGNRGIGNLLVADDFVKACISLSQSSSMTNRGVGIIVGFPLFKGYYYYYYYYYY